MNLKVPAVKARVRYVDAGTKVLGVDLLGLTGRELKVIVDSLRIAANTLHMREIDLGSDRVDASGPREEAIKIHEEEVRAASQEASALGDNIARAFQEAM